MGVTKNYKNWEITEKKCEVNPNYATKNTGIELQLEMTNFQFWNYFESHPNFHNTIEKVNHMYPYILLP